MHQTQQNRITVYVSAFCRDITTKWADRREKKLFDDGIVVEACCERGEWKR